MADRNIKRAAVRLAVKLFSRIVRFNSVVESNKQFAQRFCTLNAQIGALNERLNTRPDITELQSIMRDLSKNYAESAVLSQAWADSLKRAEAISKGIR